MTRACHGAVCTRPVWVDHATHTYVDVETGRELRSVTQVLAWDRRRRGAASWRYASGADARGTAVHAYTAALDAGVAVPALPEEWMGYIVGWQQVVSLLAPTWVGVEVATGALSGEDVAGTVDRLALVHGRRALWDLKTGAPEAWHAWQVAAYDWLLGGWAEERALVYVTAQGRARVVRVPHGPADDEWARILARWGRWR